MSKKRLKTIVLVCLAFISLLISIVYLSNVPTTNVYRGMLDAKKTPLSEKGIVMLNGEWEFYKNQLLSPEEVLNGEGLDKVFIPVPGKWKNMSEDTAFAQRGCGTYHLVIKNVSPGEQYGFIKKNIRIASRIFINGELVMEDGTPSTSEAGEVMGNSPHVIIFTAEQENIDILIQVSNFKYYSGGIIEALQFGLAEQVMDKNSGHIIFESMILAFVTAIGVMYGILALMLIFEKKKDKVSVLLPLAVVTFAVVNGALSERILMHIFPSLTTTALIRVEYTAIAMLMISLFSAIHFMENNLLPKKAIRAIQSIYIVLTLFVFVSPLKNYLTWTIFTYLTTVTLAFGFGYVLVKYFIRSQIEICIEEHSFILILLYIMNVYNLDVYMLTFGFQSNMNIAMVSTAVYGLTWLAWIFYRYKTAYNENERLTIQLLENHYAMEQTSRIARRSEMAFLQAQIKPHFLFNSLSSIISLLHIAPKRAEKVLIDLSEYLKDLFDVDMSEEYIPIQNELKIIEAYVSIEKERFKDRIDILFDIDETLLSYRIIPLLIQPLVENAMHHGILKREEGGNIGLQIKRTDDYILVKVQDNGPGFSKKAMEMIAKDIQPEAHKGVGVMNIIHRLRYYYGEELVIDNKPGRGVTLSFRVPILKEGESFVKDSHS